MRLGRALQGILGPERVGVCVGALQKDARDLAGELGVEVSASGRSEKRRRLRAEHLARSVLVATADLAKEGLDVPRLDLLLDAGVYGDATRAVQSAGRILRPVEGKPRPVVLSLVDDHSVADALARCYVAGPKSLIRSACCTLAVTTARGRIAVLLA